MRNRIYQFADLARVTGSIVKVDIETDMDDSEYHAESVHLSSSGIKDFLKTPLEAANQRLGLSPKKAFAATTLNAMRLGKAVHSYVFEGREAYLENFPVYTAGKRVGTAWKEFCKANMGAYESDTILTPQQEILSEALGPAGRLTLENIVTQIKDAGYTVLGEYPEISFFAEYSTGLKLKVRCDYLLLVQSETDFQLGFVIVDGKTTSSKVTNPTDLAFTVDSFGYHISAAMYLHVVQEAMRIPNTWKQLSSASDSVLGEAVNPWGMFNLLWINTDQQGISYQPFINYSTFSEEDCWGSLGVAGVIKGLQQYSSIMQNVHGELTECKSLEEYHGRIRTVHSKPLKTHMYKHWDLTEGMVETPFSLRPEHEIVACRELAVSLGATPKKEKKKATKEKKSREQSKPEKSKAEESKVPAVSIPAPDISFLAKGGEEEIAAEDVEGDTQGFMSIPDYCTFVDTATKAQLQENYQSLTYVSEGAEIDWKGNIRTIRSRLKKWATRA